MVAAPSPIGEIAQLVADAEAWSHWAAKVNARAVSAGLITLEEVQANHRRAEEALRRLRLREGG